MSTARDPRDLLPLAPHAFHMLLSLLEQDRHGYSIIKDISRRTGGEITLGTSTVYATLKRMTEEGLLREVAGPSDEESGGPPRQYFRLTELGRAVAREEGLRIRRLHDLVVESPLFETLGSRSLVKEES